MNPLLIALPVIALSVGMPSVASANCADDAIDTCNARHPNPNESDHAYELYELCIKAELGKQCPSSSGNIDDIKATTAVKVERTKSR